MQIFGQGNDHKRRGSLNEGEEPMEAMLSEPSGRSEAGSPSDSRMANLFDVPRRPNPPKHLLHQARQHSHPDRRIKLRNSPGLLPRLRHLHRPHHHPHLRPHFHPDRPPIHRPPLRHHRVAAGWRRHIPLYYQHDRLRLRNLFSRRPFFYSKCHA